MATIAIYAGHGGSDPGAIGVNGLQEKNLTLAVSNATTGILRGWGYNVINNRTADVNRNITADANRANSAGAAALVEIHFNSNPGTPGTGSEAFVSVRNIGNARVLAAAILRRLNAAFGYANRGVKTATAAGGADAFGILRLTNMPAVLLEVAFINNPNDMARFDANRTAMLIAESVRELYPLTGGGGIGGCTGLGIYPGWLIRRGSTGENVRRVQCCINNVAARVPGIGRLAADGIFGPLTDASVRAFQRTFGLAADGLVGPLTWARLDMECGVR